MHALIIANGPLPPASVVRRLRKSAALVVCADGGANRARGYRIQPDVILGDLDSLLRETRRFYRDRPILRIRDQESTDLEKAILFCIMLGASSADIIGALGARIDHTTGSLGCFKRFGSKIDMRFFDQIGELTRIRATIRLATRKGEHLSLIPLDRCIGVTTRNLKYPLRNDVLEPGIREGISNEATGSPVTVSVKRGTLLVYRFRNARR